MSLDPFTHQDPEVNALIVLSGAHVGYLELHLDQGVYVQIRRPSGKFAHGKIGVMATLEDWKTFLGGLMDQLEKLEQK